MLKDAQSQPATKPIPPNSAGTESGWTTEEVKPVVTEAVEAIEGLEQENKPCDLDNLRQATIVICLVILAMLAVGYTMYFAKAIFMPIVFALLLNFIFSPTVVALRKLGVPNVVGAILLMMGAFALLAGLFWMLFAPAKNWLDQAPTNIASIEQKVKTIVKPLEAIKETTEKVDRLVEGASAAKLEEEKVKKSVEQEKENSEEALPLKFGSPEPKAPDPETKPEETPVKVQLERPSMSGFVLNATGDALLGIGLAFVLLFYLLAAGDRGLEKMVELMPTFKDKKRVVGLTRDIQSSIIDYLRTTTLINIGLGIIIGTGLWLLGMPNPVLWGVMACLLNFFPMIGAVIGSAIVFMVALVSFDSISFALLAPAIYGGINIVEANFITPTLLGRSVSLHPVWLMVFFTIVTWIWGVGGAIIAVPMLAVIKITCDHSDVFAPVGKFLGR